MRSQSETCGLPDSGGSSTDPPATPSGSPEKEPDLFPFDPGGIGYIRPEGRVA